MLTASAHLVRNIHSQIAERIGTSIVRGEIGAGEQLPSEMKICEMFDVSRPVVREAIRILTGKGLIESRAKSGTRVRPPELWSHLDPDVLRWRLSATNLDTYLQKLFDLRNAVEPTASALAATAATADDRTAITNAMEGMVAATNNAEFVDADIAFHKAIYIATRNELFWPIAQMFEILLRQSFTIAALGDHRKRALAEHRAVMQAICDGDSAAARAAAITLLNNSVDDLERIRAQGEDVR
jgi:DNA-binding FadR family transcriptional regulator